MNRAKILEKILNQSYDQWINLSSLSDKEFRITFDIIESWGVISEYHFSNSKYAFKILLNEEASDYKKVPVKVPAN